MTTCMKIQCPPGESSHQRSAHLAGAGGWPPRYRRRAAAVRSRRRARMAGASRGSRRTRPSWTAAAVKPEPAAHPHTHPDPPSLAQIDARAGRARSGFGKARVGQRRRSPQACTGRQRCEGRRRRATLRRLGAQGMFMRTAACARCRCACSSPWRSTCRLGEAARHRACITSRLHRAAFPKITFPTYPPTSQIAIWYARLT